ncbi:MAG: TDP-N-acetylfucosamine:lipid II N-acetylfucosaminyltransferase [Crocinitomicaceae bacterium]|nr:TDP-N-acetylfucosamine:lipid II N-acetylfucosaminyltransferase [Crocinitomicaceae bacterium]
MSFIVFNKNESYTDTQVSSTQELIRIIQNLQPERIIIHYLDGNVAEAILLSGFEKKIHWCSWGADIYNPHFSFNMLDFLDPHTLDFFVKNRLQKHQNLLERTGTFVRSILLLIYPLFKKGKKHSYRHFENILPKISSCSTVLPFEFEFIKKRLPHVKYKAFSYGNMDSLIPKDLIDFDNSRLGKSIIVGNSASPLNNHVSIITALKEFSLIVPLSYGNENFKQALIGQFNQRNITFLTERLIYPDYIGQLKKANTLIVNHQCQQALGNIVLCLYIGMRVYFNKKNPTFGFLKSLGINVFDFESEFEKHQNTSMSHDAVVINRLALNSYWGANESKKRMNDFFD